MMNAIEVDHLRVERGGRPVIHELSARVLAGAVTGLLGPSGSGKTTLMRAIVGAQRVVSGRIVVLGRPAGSAALRSQVGYVTQAPSVYRDLSVRENLEYFAAMLGATPGQVGRVVEMVGLGERAEALVARLSGGEATRVSLAAALLGEPRLLVLDEPTVGLDPVLREDLWSLFRRLAAAGTTLIVSSHVMNEAERCERILLLREGRLLADESPGQLRDRTGAGDLDEAFLRVIRSAAAP
ncbi:MAG: ABC transporter ATP-binding protein [Actinomycetes bacterium]